MADPASAVLGTALLPSDDALDRAAAFTREPFLLKDEDPAVALAPGTPRRGALDAALAELEGGAQVPSVQWRQDWSLLLGLDRVLSQNEPHLVDGTVLSAHQVDALSGTLTALLAEVQRNGNGNGNGHVPDTAQVAPLASVRIPGEEDLPEELREEEPDEEPQDWSDDSASEDSEQLAEQPEDPNAGKRFWFEHATGAGKTVAALGFVESSQTGGILILTHRRNLVDQFHGELRDRGYKKRITAPLLRGQDAANGPVTVETYQWFVRNAGNISDAYTVVICDEAHTALGEKTSAAIRRWGEPVFIGMTATGALIARHVTDLFPTQTSRFDLAQAARRGVISPLRCVRIPPGPGVRTIAKVPLRRGEVDVEFDQEMLAELLDQQPFNLAIADLYKTRFEGLPGVVYTAGVRHAHNVAQAFKDFGLKARAVSGETPKRQLAQILAAYERGDIDVLVNAQLLAEGWNSPRATICLHLAPTASKRIYQQRVGRVTRRHPGKESGIVVDFVHPATKHDDPVVTLHSLLDREVYRGGAIVIGPVRRGRGRRLRVERRVLPVTADSNRRIEVFERELWRIAVEHLDWGEQVQWAALAGARVTLTGWRRARAMLHFDQGGELKRTFLTTAVQRNKNPQIRLRALQEIAGSTDGDAFDVAIDVVGTWPREEKREGVKVVLQALAEKKIGRRDQANNWIWRCAEYTREVHEEYAVQRWPETKRLLGMLVNSSGTAHARNARRLVHSSRDQDRRLQAAILAAAVPHTAESGEVINGARARLARKPPSLARELFKNFPKPKAKKSRRRRRKGAGENGAEGVETPELTTTGATEVEIHGGDVDRVDDGAIAVGAGVEAAAEQGKGEGAEGADIGPGQSNSSRRRGRRRRRGRNRDRDEIHTDGHGGDNDDSAPTAVGSAADAPSAQAPAGSDPAAQPQAGTVTTGDGEKSNAGHGLGDTDGNAGTAPAPSRRSSRRSRSRKTAAGAQPSAEAAAASTYSATAAADSAADSPSAAGTDAAAIVTAAPTGSEPTTQAEPRKRSTRTRKSKASVERAPEANAAGSIVTPAASPTPDRAPADGAGDTDGAEQAPAKPKRTTRARKATPSGDASTDTAEETPSPPKRTSRARKAAPNGDTSTDTAEETPTPPKRTTRARKAAPNGDTSADTAEETPSPPKRTSRARKAAPNGDTRTDTAEETPTPPKRTSRARKSAALPEAGRTTIEERGADGAEEAQATPVRKRPSRARKATVTDDGPSRPDQADRLSTNPPPASPAPAKAAPRKRPARAATTTPEAAPDVAAPPPAARKRPSRARTTASSAAVEGAQAEQATAAAPTPRRRTTAARKSASGASNMTDAVQRAMVARDVASAGGDPGSADAA